MIIIVNLVIVKLGHDVCYCFGFSTVVGASADDLEVHSKKQTSAEYKQSAYSCTGVTTKQKHSSYAK